MISESQLASGRDTRVEPVAPTITALTGLRFAAALLVVFSHFPGLVPLPGLAHGLVEQGAAGVTIFFVLSGFVLTYRYGDMFRGGVGGARAFIRGRLARIVPMAVAAMLITTAVVLTLSAEPLTRSVKSWVVNVLLLQAWIPTKEMSIWNGPAWSVSAELFFYVMFPLLTWLVVSRLRPQHFVRVAVALIAVEAALFIALAVVVERHFVAAGKTSDDINIMLQRFKSFPPLRIWEFVLGCVLGAAYVAERRGASTPFGFLRRQRTRQWVIAGVVTMLVALVVMPAIVDEPQRGLGARLLSPGLYVTYTPLAVLLVGAIAWGPTVLSKPFDHPWMQRLGDASYSFYLLQGAFLVLVFEWPGSPSRPGFWYLLPVVALLVPLSLLCERFMERPARQRLRSRRPSVVAATAAS